MKHGKCTKRGLRGLRCRCGDELLQRIGRGGRVLGKEETATPSRGLALLTTDAATGPRV
ncbi:MAG: hypothetical protein R2851_16895 [Caldilineaceae bacterium]